MFTKDLAIFGTCAATIRNRPDSDHEELILTAFVISLSLLLPLILFSLLISPSSCSSFSPRLFLWFALRGLRVYEYVRPPTLDSRWLDRSHILVGAFAGEKYWNERNGYGLPDYGWQEEGHWRGRRPSVFVSMSSEIRNNRTLLCYLVYSPKETTKDFKKYHLCNHLFNIHFNFIRKVSQIMFSTEKIIESTIRKCGFNFLIKRMFYLKIKFTLLNRGKMITILNKVQS